MIDSIPPHEHSPDECGLLLLQYFAPKEFFVIDGNPKASLLMELGIQRLRGQELDEIWPHAHSSGLMKCLFGTVQTRKPFDTIIGVRKGLNDPRVLQVRGLPISGERVMLSFRDITDPESV